MKMRHWAMIASFAAAGAVPLCAQSAADSVRYRRGFIPIVAAVVDSLPYPGTDAVIQRRAKGPPNDYILMRASAASPELLTEALFTLHAVHRAETACPKRDETLRVGPHTGVPIPLWGDRQAQHTRDVFLELQKSPERALAGVGRARSKVLWVKRFYTWPEAVPPGGPHVGVCESRFKSS